MENFIMILASLIVIGIHYGFYGWILRCSRLIKELRAEGKLEDFSATEIDFLANPIFFMKSEEYPISLAKRVKAGIFYIAEAVLFATCIFGIYGDYSKSMLAIYIGVTTIPMALILLLEFADYYYCKKYGRSIYSKH